jgi:hypothetical protein
MRFKMEEREALKFKTNIPEEVELEKIAGPYTNDDHPEWGESWLVLCKRAGKPTKFYCKKSLHEKLTGFKAGETVRILNSEQQSEDNKPYKLWEVIPATFKKNGSLREEKPDIESDEKAYEAYRKKRGSRFQDALLDAVKIVEAINDRIEESKTTGHIIETLKAEDLRAIAISMAIDYQRSK